MKFIIKTILGVFAFAISLSAQAVEGGGTGVQVGTGVLARAIEINNYYFQLPLDNTSAIVLELAKVTDFEYQNDKITASGKAIAYKTYSSKYGNGSFWKLGFANIDVKTGDQDAAGTLPVILYGAESTIGPLLFGGEIGLGTTAGFGLVNFYVGVTF